MIKIYYTIVLCLFTAAVAIGQVSGDKIRIENVSVHGKGETVEVSFTVEVGKKAVKRSHVLSLQPVLTNGEHQVSMPAIIVQGKGTKASNIRLEWAGAHGVNYKEPVIYSRNGDTVRYSTSLTSQSWMSFSQLNVESVLSGCCSDYKYTDVVFAGDIDGLQVETIDNTTVYAEVENIITIPEKKSAVSLLSERFPFISTEVEYDHTEPLKEYQANRNNSVAVYFRSGSYNIDPGYLDNGKKLETILSSISDILNTNGCSIQKIVVAGFTSPEGGSALNSRIAYKRALAMKNYISKHAGIRDDVFSVNNGSVDWFGLRESIATSDMPEKDVVLDIIDEFPVWDANLNKGRLGEIMRLKSGDVYRHIYDKYFPQMRNGVLISILIKTADI